MKPKIYLLICNMEKQGNTKYVYLYFEDHITTFFDKSTKSVFQSGDLMERQIWPT